MSPNNDMIQTANTNISNKIYKDSDEAVIISNTDHENIIKGLAEAYDEVSYDDMKKIYNNALHDLESFKTKYDEDLEREFTDKVMTEYNLKRRVASDIVDTISTYIAHPNSIQNYFNNRNVVIPMSERFSINLSYKNRNYTISIMDGDKKLGSEYVNKKPLFEDNTARDKYITNTLKKYAEIEKPESDKLIVIFNSAKENDCKDQIKQLKVRYDAYLKEIISKKLSKNQYMGKALPYPYKIVNGTLYTEDIDEDDGITLNPVSRAFTVKSIGEIKDKGENESIRYVELQFLNIDGNETTMLVEENHIIDSMQQRDNLKALSIIGTRRTEIIDYYIGIVDKNEIEISEITKIGGWKDDFTRYVTGDMTYGIDKEYMLFDNSSMENIHQQGTLNNWIEGVYELLNDPVFAFILYSGICALIQRPLGIPNYNILFINLSSTGKTTGAKLRSSPFGDPHKMMITSNSSKQGIPNTVKAYNDVPVHVDEIKKEDIPVIRSLIYNISFGEPRTVATKNGGVKNNKHESFCTNAIYTTEEEILDESAKMGQFARIIPITKTPKINPVAVKKFEDMICNRSGKSNNYGLALELIVPKVISMIQDGTLKARFDEIQKELESYNVNKSSLVDRLIEYYAGITLAGEIFNETIVKCPENKDRIKALNPLEITKEFMQDYMEQKPDESEGTRAMKVVIDWYNGNKYKFNEPEPIKYSVDGETDYRDQALEFYGYDKGETIDIFLYKAKELLTKQGFNPNTILNTWNKDGYTICKADRNIKYVRFTKEQQDLIKSNKTLQEKFGKGANTSAVSIKKSMIQHLLIKDDDTTGNDKNAPDGYTPEERNELLNREPRKLNLKANFSFENEEE